MTARIDKLLDLPGIAVIGVAFAGRALLVDVRLRARRLTCPRCAFTTGARYDTVKRADGKLQVTYAGHPLYHFAQSATPGNVSGHGVDGFGPHWDAVRPS